MTTTPIINVYISTNTYKSAVCQHCLKILVKGTEIVSISKSNGVYNSISNYHIDCSRPFVVKAFESTKELLGKIILVSQKLDEFEFNKETVSIKEVEKTKTK